MSREPASLTIQSGLQGSLLIAMPQLRDPNFHRSVTLMLSHDAKGALGLVLGAPTETTVADVASQLGLRWTRRDVLRVRIGGPCERERIWLVHGGSAPLEDAAQVVPGVFVGSSPRLLAQLDENPDVPLLVVGGYAGWAPGQLEAELGQNSWLPGDLSPELIFTTPPDELWEQALRQMGLSPARIISGGDASA